MLEVIIQVRAGWRAADDYDCEDNDDEVYEMTPMIMIPQVRLAERREAIAMMLMMVFMR